MNSSPFKTQLKLNTTVFASSQKFISKLFQLTKIIFHTNQSSFKSKVIFSIFVVPKYIFNEFSLFSLELILKYFSQNIL